MTFDYERVSYNRQRFVASHISIEKKWEWVDCNA